ncbi:MULTISPECIES: hypothetical protein [Pseudoalteromonas]|uniref:hypothetical protein n=1 Tax=Pseudoalteromonas TaxID=53246 RepID=UPI00029A7970|nr:MULTISPECIES: hypothetical protein [Pseudoalteromonas]TMN34923.1 hypothetical protein CWC03_16090 [Pseudoalteromonas sp. S2755]
MGNFISKNVSLFATLYGVWWVYNYFKVESKPFTKSVASVLAEIQFAANGSNYIKYPNAGFVLDPDKLNPDYTVRDKTWLKAMSMTHDDHMDYLERLFDGNLQLRPRYQPLIGQIVTAQALDMIDKG